MAQGVIEAFYVVGEATVLAGCDMTVFREYFGVGFPIVGIADGGLLVGSRQGVPQGLRPRMGSMLLT